MDEDLDGQISLEEFRVHMSKALEPEPKFVFPESVIDIDFFEVFVHYDKAWFMQAECTRAPINAPKHG